MNTLIRCIFVVLLATGYVSGACMHVPNEDMIEYSCDSGHPNDLYSIPERTEKIRITNMKIPRVTPDTFSRFGDNLWVLTCTNCGIMEIEPDSFKSLMNLQQLRLDTNNLKEVRAIWFEGLKQLTYLDLNYNEIETIEDGVFDNLPALIDLRISGNKLECLNVDELSRLGDLRRIFIAKNPELKCPNAISRVLEQKQVDFERDPDWNKIPHDLVSPQVNHNWRSTTPAYRERLVSTKATESTYENTNYYQTSASYPNYESTERTNEWPSSGSARMSYTSEPSYPTPNWPTAVTEVKPEDSTYQTHPYNEPYYPPQLPRSSTHDYTYDMKYPTLPATTAASTDSGETLTATDYSSIDTMPTVPVPKEIPMIHEENYQTSKPEVKQTSEVHPQPHPLENYQQIDEKEPITVNPSNPQMNKPKADNSSASFGVSYGLIILVSFYSLTRTF